MRHIRFKQIFCLLLAVFLIAGCMGPGFLRPVPPDPATAVEKLLPGSVLVGPDTTWRYVCGVEPAPDDSMGWTHSGYHDGGWEAAQGSFGAKSGDQPSSEGTAFDNLLPMTDASGRTLPVYFFRAAFSVEDPAAIPALQGELLYDDSVIVSINGVEVFSGNLPEGGFESSLSFGAQAALDEPRTGTFLIPASMLQAGENILAVELHQASESSSDIYFGFSGLLVEENRGTLAADGFCLFLGDQNSVTARWYGDGQAMTLRYGLAGAEDYPDEAKSAAPVLLAGDADTRYSALMTNLAQGTNYTCWVEGEGRSLPVSFSMPEAEDFSFLYLGDPQITGDTSAKALAEALRVFSNNTFALLAGDLADSSNEIEQYRLFLNTEGLSSLPMAAVIGNHEGPALYDRYFAPEGLPASGRDFRFSVGDTLFVCLDSNSEDMAAHGAFLRESIDSGDWNWVIVCMHHSLFSLGKHAATEDAGLLRQRYAPMFAACDVDLVLSGHDHIYARTKLMAGTISLTGGTEVLSKAAGQTLYVSAGSSTGSKYYERTSVDTTPFAIVSEEERPMVSKIRVLPDRICLTTRYADDGSLLDEVVLTRAGEGTEPQAVNTETVSLKKQLIKSEKDYLLSTRLPNGALSMYPVKEGDNPVNPYFGDYAAMALLFAGEKETVRNYIIWRFLHLNTADYDVNNLAYTIYDYTVTVENGQIANETASMSYDSTDSYAATLLLLLREYYRSTGDAALLRTYYPHITGVAQVLLATTKDGLTLARPDYPVRYLMDNCEVHLSLEAADDLIAQVLLPALTGGDAANCLALQTSLRSLQDAMTISLEELLWNEAAGRYEYALMKNGKVAGFDSKVFYPDGIAQLCPAIYGLLAPNSSRAQALYNGFCKNWDWAGLALLDEGDTNHYWGMAAYCAAVMGDEARLMEYLAAYQARVAVNHAYPLHNADAAWVAMACAYGESAMFQRLG